MQIDAQTIDWLLEGDVSIQYQIQRDLLGSDLPALRERIAAEGWGAGFLQLRQENGHWGRGFYQPKWISAHYTLLDIKNLGFPPDHPLMAKSVSILLRDEKGGDGGVNPARTIHGSDVCVNGMFLNYACYFKADETELHSVIDFVIAQHMPDGGYNCHFNRPGAVHSSLHSTISVLEGLQRVARHVNDAWSMDFVHDQTQDGRRLRFLTIVDVYSRECLGIEVGRRLRGEDVVNALTRIAARRSTPKRIYCDNGSEFQSRLVDLWAYRQHVVLEFSRPGKPTDNAHIESFNGTFRDECLNLHWFWTLADAQAKIQAWCRDYNESRPHRALNNLAPLEYAAQKAE